MSDQDLDRLFRNKLEDISKEPSQRAWEQISEALPQKRKGGLFFRIAAAILLLMAAGSAIWFLGQNGPEPTLADNSPVKNSTEAPVTEKAAETVTKTNEEATTEETAQPAVKKDLPSGRKNQAFDTQKTHQNVMPEQKENASQRVTKETDVPVQKPEVTEPMIASTDIPRTKESGTATAESTVTGQTLSFNIDDFGSAEKMTATIAGAEPASPDSEEEGLKKFWNVLKKVKEPEAGLGELRDLKNNFLAFGKEKNETD